jgi:DNA-binding response OmpR family regulator
MTGETQERDPQAGANPILFKPFSIEELFALVKKALCGTWEDRSAVSAKRQDLTESDVI